MLLWSSAQTIHQLGGCRKKTPSQKKNSCHQVGCQDSYQMMPPHCIDGGANLHSTSCPLPGSDDAQALFWRCTLPLGMGCNFRISLRFNKCNLAIQQLGPTHSFCRSCPIPRTTQGSSVRHPLESDKTSLSTSQSTQGALSTCSSTASSDSQWTLKTPTMQPT